MFARPRLPRLVRASVVVHTRDGRSFAGVLIGVYPDSVALAHPRLLNDGTPVQLEGELLLPRENLAFLQADVALDEIRPPA